MDLWKAEAILWEQKIFKSRSILNALLLASCIALSRDKDICGVAGELGVINIFRNGCTKMGNIALKSVWCSCNHRAVAHWCQFYISTPYCCNRASQKKKKAKCSRIWMRSSADLLLLLWYGPAATCRVYFIEKADLEIAEMGCPKLKLCYWLATPWFTQELTVTDGLLIPSSPFSPRVQLCSVEIPCHGVSSGLWVRDRTDWVSSRPAAPKPSPFPHSSEVGSGEVGEHLAEAAGGRRCSMKAAK